MRSLRQWLFFAAVAAAGVGVYMLAGAASQLSALLGDIDDATARIAADQAPTAPISVPEPPARAASANADPVAAPGAEPEGGSLRQPMPTDDLSAAQILRLLEDEIATATDPAAADEFLRAFDETLDTHE